MKIVTIIELLSDFIRKCINMEYVEMLKLCEKTIDISESGW